METKEKHKNNDNRSVLLDITKEFSALKSDNTCNVCDQIFSDPIALHTCQHVFCRKCLNLKLYNCPICQIPFATKDVEDDLFTKCVLTSIETIEQILLGGNITEIIEDVPESPEGETIWKQILNSIVLCTEMKRNPKGETPLHVACRKGQLSKVNEFIANNVDLNVKDYAGWTPMHEAVEGGHIECVEALLEGGALSSVPGEFYMTPLHKAASAGNVKLIRTLIKYGVDVNSKDYSGLTPMAMATEEVQHQFLLQNSEKHITPKYFIHSNPVVHCSAVSKDSINAVKKHPKIKLVSPEDFINKDEVTHLILGENEDISMKVLFAILKGLFVVRENWIKEYIETDNKKLVFNFIASNYRKTFDAAILNNLQKLPRLFDGMNFHFIDHNKPYKIYNMEFTKIDLIKLVEVGGGKHLHRPPALRTVEGVCFYPYHIDRNSNLSTCTNYIIYMETQPPQLLYNMMELRHKTSRWLIDCILNFAILTS